MPAVQPGSRWIQRHGRHEGTEAEVVDVNDVAVYLKNVGSNGANWGGQKSDDSKTYHLATDVFLARYVRREDAGTNPNGGSSWRRVAKPKPKPVTVAPQQPLTLNGLVMTGDTHLNLEILEVTPMQAEAWLERSGEKRNRTISERRVAKLTAAIQRGEWQLTGDSIKLDADGIVRDGRHRLTAIARAGVPVTVLVVRNVTEQAFDVIDTGASRAPHDILAIHGYQYGIVLAASSRLLMLIERYGRAAPGLREADLLITNASILAYTQAHEDDFQPAVAHAGRLKQAGLTGGVSLWTTLVILCRRANPEQGDRFFDLLLEGAGLESDSPILRLRNRVIGGRYMRGTTARDREAWLAMGLKAWNAWRSDETIKQLSWHSGQVLKEPFPTAI